MRQKKLAALGAAMACAAVLCGCTVNINLGGEVEKLPSAAAEATAPVETTAAMETTATVETTAAVETTLPVVPTVPSTEAATPLGWPMGKAVSGIRFWKSPSNPTAIPPSLWCRSAGSFCGSRWPRS